jgi:hypothetical protein
LASLIAVLMPVALMLGLAQPERVESWSDLLHPAITRVYEEPPKSEDRRGAMAESRGGRARSLTWVAATPAELTSTVLPGMILQLQPECWHYQTLLPNAIQTPYQRD